MLLSFYKFVEIFSRDTEPIASVFHRGGKKLNTHIPDKPCTRIFRQLKNSQTPLKVKYFFHFMCVCEKLE